MFSGIKNMNYYNEISHFVPDDNQLVILINSIQNAVIQSEAKNPMIFGGQQCKISINT